MKNKMMISITALLLFGVASVKAQSSPTMSNPSPSVQQKQDTRGSEWTKVESTQIPDALKLTLKEEKYTGWETAGIYYNKSTKQYSADTKTGAISNNYRFDVNGKFVPATGNDPRVSPGMENPNAGPEKKVPTQVPNE